MPDAGRVASDDSVILLFRSQLDTECDGFVSQLELENSGQGLIWWYFATLHGLEDTEIEGILCDGGGDQGMDAIWIDENNFVHFYQFKRVSTPDSAFPTGDLDKFLSGLRFVITGKHEGVSNQSVITRIREVRSKIRSGYRIHLVSTGRGLGADGRAKLDSTIGEMGNKLFQWTDEPILELYEAFYRKTTPAADEPIVFSLTEAPHSLSSGNAESHFFSASGLDLAALYDKFRENLLQRNIRVDQGATATNRLLERACSSDDSGNFLHYNNGVSFLCEEAVWHNIQKQIVLKKAQIVNGGQTIRSLHKMSVADQLKPDVVVPVRAIASRDSKEFGNNVTVNQNNQNQVKPEFLQSNDVRIVQLSHSLATKGWYLERRKGELASAAPEERSAIEVRIGHPLEGRVIKLKQGMQAFVATFFENPEVAKKDPSRIFKGPHENGYFDAIFSQSNGRRLTEDKFIVAHQIMVAVERFTSQFASRKRRKARVDDWKAYYAELLGRKIVDEFQDEVEQVVPQTPYFIAGTLYQDACKIQGMPPAELADELTSRNDRILEHLYLIMRFAKENPEVSHKAWPFRLRSGQFFKSFLVYLRQHRKTASV